MPTVSELFDLRSEEFELLCAAILRAEGYKHTSIVSGSNFDVRMIAEKDGGNVVVAIRHKRRPLSVDELENICSSQVNSVPKPNGIVVLTSSPITRGAREYIQSHKDIVAFGGNDIVSLLQKHKRLEQEQFFKAHRRSVVQKISFFIAILGVLTSILFLLSGWRANSKVSGDLVSQIETVDKALQGISGLEDNLRRIRSDLEKTSHETESILAEHQSAQKLQELTQQQYSTIRVALTRVSWRDTLWSSFAGFVLGIASSIIAAVIYDKWKQWVVLTK